MKKNKKRPTGLWDTIKWNNILIIGVLEEETEGQKTYFKK